MIRRVAVLFLAALFFAVPGLCQQPHAGRRSQPYPARLGQAKFWVIWRARLIDGGLLVCALGLVFGLLMYTRLKNLPVHSSMMEISELIYETCKTYLLTQGKFLMILELFIGAAIVFYFGFLRHFEA